jgi:ABC-type transporter Mla MlaB component
MLIGRAAYDDGMLRITRTGKPAVLAIAGEINEYTYAGLVGALSKLTAGHHEIHISLGEVASCELAGLRAMILLTGASSADRGPAARRLILHEVPRQLKTVLRILGWDSTPGLEIPGPHQQAAPAPRADRNVPPTAAQPTAAQPAAAQPAAAHPAASHPAAAHPAASHPAHRAARVAAGRWAVARRGCGPGGHRPGAARDRYGCCPR